MRLVIYNVRYGTGTGLSYHLPFPFSGSLRRSYRRFESIKSFLQGLSPDLVGLVEADNGSYRQAGICQAKEIAKAVGGESHFVVKYRDNLSRLPVLKSQGNAVISRVTPLKVNCHDLGRGMKRNALEVEFNDFSMVLVHLSLGKTSREHQIGALKEICTSRKGPLILAGDYNTLKGSDELSPLIEAGMSTVNKSGIPTFPCRRPRKELDFILVSEDIEPQGFFVPNTYLSDHLPLVCDLKIRKSERRDSNYGLLSS
ncbi:endonuclease/exonuclease/phosphatase family protein [Dethiosulfovibrio salsuginis]|uniref:Metal-dependent hydrolase, endonuclease/exonuclease/phosphatase family n=1 Tax=Dethiosulfovibrio salsuginis TaxID=561720 RepID=A0A1X7JUR2_9BACT|nr:endonuclease/exonuclease/phosphatase family protein [Dethiosulfovibrio salsuginis]SMG31926.1 Metal-dependent hydrolase, endonuclease/exonuclease/phosphatase family [Dethiosulfovibrio salsuginis]